MISEKKEKTFTDLGQIVCTIGISREMETNGKFGYFITHCFQRYMREDWGEMCPEDIDANNSCRENGGRILASYNIPEEAQSELMYDNKVYIITEWDRSVTTVLFPSEY